MQCTFCGIKIPDGGFCPACGRKAGASASWPQNSLSSEFAGTNGLNSQSNRQSAAVPPAGDTAYSRQPRPAGKFCPDCGTNVAADAQFCGGCGHRFASSPAPAKKAPPAGGGKKFSSFQMPAKGAPILAGIAIVLVIVLIVGICTSWLGLTGPLMKIGSAVEKTVKKGNFTAEFEFDVEGDSAEGLIMMNVDYKKRDLTVYMELEVDGTDSVFGIYDESMFMRMDYGSGSYYNYMDISDYLDGIFDAYEENSEEIDIQELLDQLDDQMDGELSEVFDFKQLEKCLNTYVKELNSASWLKDNAGYSKESKSGVTYYNFKPDSYDFTVASLPFFEKAFEDPDVYEDVMDEIEDVEEYFDDVVIEFSIGVKSGYLAALNGEAEIDGDNLEFAISIYDVGETTIDTAELEDLMEEAEENQ